MTPLWYNASAIFIVRSEGIWQKRDALERGSKRAREVRRRFQPRGVDVASPLPAMVSALVRRTHRLTPPSSGGPFLRALRGTKGLPRRHVARLLYVSACLSLPRSPRRSTLLYRGRRTETTRPRDTEAIDPRDQHTRTPTETVETDARDARETQRPRLWIMDARARILPTPPGGDGGVLRGATDAAQTSARLRGQRVEGRSLGERVPAPGPQTPTSIVAKPAPRAIPSIHPSLHPSIHASRLPLLEFYGAERRRPSLGDPPGLDLRYDSHSVLDDHLVEHGAASVIEQASLGRRAGTRAGNTFGPWALKPRRTTTVHPSPDRAVGHYRHPDE